MVEELKALKGLLDAGVITQAEFDAKKKQLLEQPFQQSAQQPQSAQAQYQQSPAPGSVTSEKSKLVAGILAITLGWLGVHKFYLGYTTQGIIHLLISFLGALLIIGPFVCAVISFIEGITYLSKSDEAFHRIYVQGQKPWF